MRAERGDVSLIPIGRRPRLVGRDSGVDVVIRDPAVSRHHLLIWQAAGRILVRDVGSALGTRIGNRELSPGDCLAVGADDEILLAGRIRLHWRLGGSGEADLEPAAVVSKQPAGSGVTGTFALAVADDDLPTDPRRAVSAGVAVTIACSGGGPREVRLEDELGHELRVRGENRVVLLFLLAEQRRRYDEGEIATPWVADLELGVGLWGTRGRKLPSSRINTVIARIRAQLRAASLPPELLQKQAGRTRLGGRAGRVVIDGNPGAREGATREVVSNQD